MPAYFSLGTKNSDTVSNKYLQINNCGFCEDMDKTAVSRPRGRMDHQLIYIKKGQMDFGGQLLGAGFVYLFLPGQPQHYRVCGSTTFYWIHFTGSALPDILKGCGGAIFHGEFPEFERLCKNFYMEHRLSDAPNTLYYEGLLICLLAQLTQKQASSKPPHRRLEAALLAMNQNIAHRLSNEELAQMCGLSKFYFIKLFKEVTGSTPQLYYVKQAVDTAKGLLESTDHTVSQIASLCGMEDAFYFSRVFKKHTGVCPADYRKALR